MGTSTTPAHIVSGAGKRMFVENISPLLGGQHGMEADITIEGDQMTAQDGNSVTTFRRAGLPRGQWNTEGSRTQGFSS